LGKKDLYRIMSDVADGMATLESLNIAHGNVCVSPTFHLVCVLQQPLSILVFEAGSLFKVGNFLGELGSPEHAYLAPEVPSMGASSASDVWVGCVPAPAVTTSNRLALIINFLNDRIRFHFHSRRSPFLSTSC
jgi:hypothetical protein